MRILFKLIILVIIIVVAGLIALPFVVDPNDYKQEISDQVEKATGRILTLDGDIGLSVFPWIALEMGPLSLSNAKGFKAEQFAKVEAAEIRIKLLPLLKKQLEMDTVILDGLVLNLEKDKAGKTNWDDLTGSEKTDASPKEAESKPSDDSTPALAAISIAGVHLSNANILWADASTSESYSLENLNLTTDPLVPGEPTAVEMDFDINSVKPQATAHIKLNTKVMVDLENQQYSLTGLEFTTQAEGKELPFSKAEITLNGDVNLDMLKQLASIDNLSLAIQANKDQQQINAKLTANVSSNLANQQTTLKAVDLTAEINDPALPGEKAEIKLVADINADMQQQTMSVSALVLELQDLLINGDINVGKLLSDNPDFAGQINIKPFNLRQLANKLAIELPPMADSSTLELVQLKTTFEGSTKHFNAKQLDLTLDQSKLTGQLAVDNFTNPAVKFKLALDEIDVDRYLPPVTEQDKVASGTPDATPSSATATAGDSEFPLETLRQINVKGILDIGKLKVSGIHSEKIHLEINAADGLIKLHPMSANLYQGQYQGNVNLDARGKILKLSIDENLKAVQVGPLLKDLSGDDKISGTANAKAKLTGKGVNVDQIKQTLTGNGQFSFTDGAVKGVNIAESIRKAKAALKGEKSPSSKAPLKTDFSSLTGTFKATNGIIENRDLLIMSPLLRINGTGKIDLPKEGINYGLKVSIVGTSKGQDGNDLADLKGLTIPVQITGTFDQPKPTVDIATLVKEQATEEMKAKVADKLEGKLGSELGGLLGGALGAKKSETTSTEPTSKPAETTTPTQKAKPAQEAPAESPEEALKNKLKSLF